MLYHRSLPSIRLLGQRAIIRTFQMALLSTLLFVPVRVEASVLLDETVEPVTLAPPTLVTPENNVVTTGINTPPLGLPLLSWQSVADATQYGVEVSTSAGFAELVVNVTTFATSYALERSLADGDYYWRVRGKRGVDLGSLFRGTAFYQRLERRWLTRAELAFAGRWCYTPRI